MIVCLDSGNTRIKWGVHDGAKWLAQGAVTHADVAQLSRLVAEWPRPASVVLANVAGPEAGERIRQQLAAWLPVFREVHAEARRCGVSNHYKYPERLGVDRWCALLGARGLVESAAVVVMAGTATTIDTLDADGNFLGGVIMPGVGLMLRSLAHGTAALPFADGEYVAYPRCTDDAIVTGVIEAQTGAIERIFSRLADPAACCLLSGGYAGQLAAHLVIEHRLTHNLPLEGLRHLARQA